MARISANCMTHGLGLSEGSLVVAAAVMLGQPSMIQAAPGEVLSHQKISATEGDFAGQLEIGDNFGETVTTIGDLDGDGVVDIAVGALTDDDGGLDCGAVWILFLNSDGTVKSHGKISATEGGFTGTLDPEDWFSCVTWLGDLDGDGVGDLAVGAPADDDGGIDRGAVWILFLNGDGTVREHQKISSTEGGFTGILDDEDWFGVVTAPLEDLDNDGVVDLAVSAINDDDGVLNAGSVWVLFLNTDGTVKAHQKISATEGGFAGALGYLDWFGNGVTPLGDLDRDGVADLAVGATGDDDGPTNSGAVWILFLNTDGTVRAHQKISSMEGGFTGQLNSGDQFGRVSSLGDVDGDGVQDLAAGAHWDDDGFPPPNRGAVWLLFLNNDGTVKASQKISATEGGFQGVLGEENMFGFASAWLGDLDGDGFGDLAVTSVWDDDGGLDIGSVWILFLDEEATTSVGTDTVPPQAMLLAANPNPFRAQTLLQYFLPSPTAVRLLIHGPSGRRVATLVDRVQAAGPHSATWDGLNDSGEPVASGIYFCDIRAGRLQEVRNIVLTR